MPFMTKRVSGCGLVRARRVAQLCLIIICCVVLHRNAAALDESTGHEPRRLQIVGANLSLDNRQPLNVTKVIVRESADILVLLEWTGLNADAGMLLAQGYTFVVNEPRKGTRGIAMLAKAGLSASGGLISPPVRGPCGMPFGIMSFTVDGQQVALIGIHAPPPIAACGDTTRPTLEAVLSWVEEGRLTVDKKPAVTGHWLILAGDFNARPSERSMQRFADRGLIDTNSRSDSFYEPTWSPYVSGPRFVRIDYIFVPREFSVLSHRAIRLPGSDHAAVAAEIAVGVREVSE